MRLLVQRIQAYGVHCSQGLVTEAGFFPVVLDPTWIASVLISLPLLVGTVVVLLGSLSTPLLDHQSTPITNGSSYYSTKQ
ncbi:hypothetical protein PGQ11_007928 [Apiospora arundinis]|uniref:Uncharacterized protein n=1 Tax=Apiospora arundinis TaxID=335852 RepID=A0ABR2IX29_9PEZI